MKKILIVDDDEILLETTVELLRYKMKNEATIFTATDGLLGWEKFQEVRPELVITDLSMPSMNGNELALKIRSIHPDFPIIMTTGYLDDVDPATVSCVIEKPARMRTLLESIRKFL